VKGASPPVSLKNKLKHLQPWANNIVAIPVIIIKREERSKGWRSGTV
jgi:hypothetical protein